MEFPQISVGLDLEDLDRWRAGGLRVVDPDSRVFSVAERAYCEQQADPAPHFAARWCAKEAVVKALAPLARLHVTQIEIGRDTHGRPVAAWRETEAPAGLLSLQLSLTHSRTAVAAVALAVYTPSAG